MVVDSSNERERPGLDVDVDVGGGRKGRYVGGPATAEA